MTNSLPDDCYQTLSYYVDFRIYAAWINYLAVDVLGVIFRNIVNSIIIFPVCYYQTVLVMEMFGVVLCGLVNSV